jgi:hypothetical protein
MEDPVDSAVVAWLLLYECLRMAELLSSSQGVDYVRFIFTCFLDRFSISLHSMTFQAAEHIAVYTP